MRLKSKAVIGAALVAVSLGGLVSTSAVMAGSHMEAIQKGKKLAFNRKKGNCLACHQIAGGVSPGKIGPPLVAMKARFPDKAVLRAQVYDATVKNPDTSMLPFGAHGILNKKELDLVVDYIYTL